MSEPRTEGRERGRSADFRSADFKSADFRSADRRGADLSGVVMPRGSAR
ncbi:pentapeptide repeat-containing protein [Kitasatospora sp. NBC_01302]